MKNINSLVACVCFFLFMGVQPIFSQVIIEGYAFESGNRGFLNQVFVEVFDSETNELISRARSQKDGKFELTAPGGKDLILKGSKDLFHATEMNVSTKNKAAKEKVFVKLEMNRAPGYIFDITMADKRDDEDQVVDAIRGALVEVYNNTIREPVLVLEDHPHPDFKIDLEKGNHYTIMIRKEGYLAKRMEAFVNVKGCILCFEGIGEVQPGVSDNLTEGNKMGTLLANVELDKVYTGKKITLNNIYYDYGKASIRKDAVEELENAITFLMDNPRINVELASHTDARGLADKNQALSEKRARNTVEWIFENSDLPAHRIAARGYGENKLLNKCNSTADCTEAEHAINRRTEFKILSISAAKEPFKSLEKIKLEENMDDIIAELQSEGQVKAKDESDLKKIIKQESESKSQNEKIGKPETTKSKVDKVMGKSSETSAQDEAVENATSNVQEKKNNALKSELDKTIVKAETTGVMKEKVKAAEAIEKVKNMNASKEAAAIVKAEPEMTIEEVNKAAKTTTSDLSEIEKTKVDKQPATEEVSKVKARENVNHINTIGDFTGYKYVIQFSGTALSDDNVIFETHDDVEILQTGANNFLYMIGDYATKVYAKSGLATIKKKYPEAYVIGFENGERVE